MNPLGMEKPVKGVGSQTGKNSLHGWSMDIFWNYTLAKIFV